MWDTQGLGNPIGAKRKETDAVKELIAINVDVIRTQERHPQLHDEAMDGSFWSEATPSHRLLE